MPSASNFPKYLLSQPVQMDRTCTPFPACFCALVGFLCFVVLLPGFLFAQTEVEGEVSGEWQAEGSPYILIESAQILDGESLTINPGVEVIFRHNTNLEVFGLLRVSGNENDSVTFTAEIVGDPDNRPQIIGQNRTGALLFDYGTVSPDAPKITGDWESLEICNSHLPQIYIVDARLIDISFSTIFLPIHLDERMFDERLESFNFHDLIMNQTIAEFSSVPNCEIYNIIGVYEPGERSSITFDAGSSIEMYHMKDIWVRKNPTVAGLNDFHCHSNDGGGFVLDGVNGLEFHDNINVLTIALASSEDITIENNQIIGQIHLAGSDNIIVQRNVIFGNVVNEEGSIYFSHGSNATIINNTICAFRREYNAFVANISGFIDSEFSNNILFGNDSTDRGCTGLSISGRNFTSGFNCIYNCEEPLHGIDVDETYILDDPRLTFGYPLELELLWDSPCIDAGNPELEPDPDGSRRDIGANWLDQRVDPPPSITSKHRTFASRDWEFRYKGSAIDNSNHITFSILNHPDWLEIQDHEPDAGHCLITGLVPANQNENFTFQLCATDDQDNTDIQTVLASVTDHTFLYGDVDAALTSDHSPYIVVDTVTVSRESRLILEEGVEIYVADPSIDSIFFDPGKRIGVYVDGEFSALGTADNPVFVRRLEGVREVDWAGFNILEGETPVRLEYLDYSKQGSIKIFDRPMLIVENCYFHDGDGLRTFRGDSVIFRNNVSLNIGDGHAVQGYAMVSVDSCQFIHCGFKAYGDSIQINNCVGTPGGFGMQFSEPRTREIPYGRITNCIATGMSVKIDNHIDSVDVVVENNTITSHSESAINLGENNLTGLSICNNIIRGTGRYGLAICDSNLTVEGNLFDITGDKFRFLMNQNIEGLLIPDRVNANGDSCDQYGNMNLPAHLIGFGPRYWAPSQLSPAVDAGNPDDPRDPDDSVDDIGVDFFDHDNRMFRPIDDLDYDDEVNPESGVVFSFMTYDNVDSLGYYRFIVQGIDLGTKSFSLAHRPPDLVSISDTLYFMNPGEYSIQLEVTDCNSLQTIEATVFVMNNGVEDENGLLPEHFSCEPVFPNPFNNEARLNFNLRNPEFLDISIYDILGRRIKTLTENYYCPGSHSISINGSELSSGQYFIQLNSSDINRIVTIQVIK